MKKLIGLACMSALLVVGCGDDDSDTDSGIIDIGDAGTDTTPPPRRDTSPPPPPDTGTFGPCEDLGENCSADRGCARSRFCQGEISFDLNSNEDPVQDLPAGEDTTGVYFAGGYCTPDDISADSLGLCDPTDEDDAVCGPCGTCVNFGQDTACLRSCEAAVDGRDVCREGYACDLSLEVCIFGCNNDAECRINREDTNMVPGIQSPQDCELAPMVCDGDCYCGEGDAAVYCDEDAMDDCDCAGLMGCSGEMTNFDALRYNTDSQATCNTDTGRCQFPGTPGVEGGEPCVSSDEECEANGRCISEADFDWPGGTCTKFRCDLPGNECAGDAVCGDRRVGVHLCLQGCTVADGADPMDSSTWITNNGGCRDGYACVWNGSGGAGTANNGHCVPGQFNPEITENNFGEPCANDMGMENADSKCFSPFGQGFCFQESSDGGFPGGYCSMLDCQAPGLPTDVCGEGNVCIDIDGASGDVTACLKGCDNADACREGYACADIDGNPMTSGGACLPNCTTNEECRMGETCTIPMGEMFGTCG